MGSFPQCFDATLLLEGMLSDLRASQPCSQDKAHCMCSTVPARLQCAVALVPPPATAAGHESSATERRHRMLNSKLLLQLCEELVQHSHSLSAVLAATGAFYRLAALPPLDLLQSAAASAGNTGSAPATDATLAAAAAKAAEQYSMVTLSVADLLRDEAQTTGTSSTSTTSSSSSVAAAATSQQPTAARTLSSATYESVLQQMQTSAVVQQCVIDTAQPLFKQWCKVLKRMHAVLQKLPPGTSTFSPANALKLRQWLAEGPTSSSELSTTISNSHILLLWMAAVLRACNVPLHEPLTQKPAASPTTVVNTAYSSLPSVTAVARMLLQAAVMTRRLQAVGVHSSVHVPPAAAAAALEYACMLLGRLGTTCYHVARFKRMCVHGAPHTVQVTVPRGSPAAAVLSAPDQVAFLCNAVIAVFGSAVFCHPTATGWGSNQPQQAHSSSGDGGGGSSSSRSNLLPPSGSSLAQGLLLLRRADRLQAKPDSWDQEFAGTHSRCWQQLYQQHWADLGFPPSLLHPVIDSLCALNSSAAGDSSGSSSSASASSSSLQHGPISTASAVQAVSAAVEVLLTMAAVPNTWATPNKPGLVAMHSHIMPLVPHPVPGVGLVMDSSIRVTIPRESSGHTPAAVLLGKTPLWLLPLVSMQLQQQGAAGLSDITNMLQQAAARPADGMSYWEMMWMHSMSDWHVQPGEGEGSEQKQMLSQQDVLLRDVLLLVGQVATALRQLLWLSDAAPAAVDQHQQLSSSNTSQQSGASTPTSNKAATSTPVKGFTPNYWRAFGSCSAALFWGLDRVDMVLGRTDSSLRHTHQDSLCEQLAAAMQAAEAAMRLLAAATKQQQQQMCGADAMRVLLSGIDDVPAIVLKLLTLPNAAPDAGSTVHMSHQQQQLLLATVSFMLSCLKCRHALPAQKQVVPVGPAHVYMVLLLALQDARAAAAASATKTAATSTPAATTTVLPPLLHAALTLVGRWGVCAGAQLLNLGGTSKWLSSTESLDFLANSQLQQQLPPTWKRRQLGAGVNITVTRGQIVQQLLLLFDRVVQELPALIQRQPQQQPGVGAGIGSSSSSGSSGSSNALAAAVVELLRTCTLQQLRGQHPSATVPPLAGSTSAAAAAPPPAVEELPAWLRLFGGQLCAALPSPFGCSNPSCANLATVSEGFALVRGKACVCGGCCVADSGSSVTAGGQVEGEATPMAARYCSVACQAAHWPQHKTTCVVLRHKDLADMLGQLMEKMQLILQLTGVQP